MTDHDIPQSEWDRWEREERERKFNALPKRAKRVARRREIGQKAQFDERHKKSPHNQPLHIREEMLGED